MNAVTLSRESSYMLAAVAACGYAEPVTIGQNVVQLRTAAGFKTQTAFAQAMGVPQPRVADLEKSRYKFPDIKTLLIRTQRHVENA